MVRLNTRCGVQLFVSHLFLLGTWTCVATEQSLMPALALALNVWCCSPLAWTTSETSFPSHATLVTSCERNASNTVGQGSNSAVLFCDQTLLWMK